MSRFEVKEKFYLDGKEFQIISGAIHYFRVVPEYWQDRLEKLRNMGCNTVETYIPWNFHEEKKGEFSWDGRKDFCKFFELAESLGLYVIVRPSPFICAEWELGGLPAWLLADPDIKLRCSCESFLKHVREYYSKLIPLIVPHQIDNGGNIILAQIENEYGYYGNDKKYLEFLGDLMRELGMTVPFVTSDGPWGQAFTTGQTKGALPTGNFGTAAKFQFSQMKKMMDGDKPLMCMEFWDGWFDAWGNKKKKKSVLSVNKIDLEYFLENGNVNFYMFHGGTNFGFMNGSNYYGKLTPDTTSYDYDAPVAEDGTLTKKYFVFRDIIARHKKIDEVPLSTDIKRTAYGTIFIEKYAPLFENLDVISQVQESTYPLSMECAGQNTGYILYKTKLRPDESAKEIIFEHASDRLQAFADGKKLFTAFDKEISSEPHGIWPFTFTEGKKWKVSAQKGAEFSFLLENMGRVNFGHQLENQRKGITGAVLINGHRHFGWQIYTLPFDERQMNFLRQNAHWIPTTTDNPVSNDEHSVNPAFFSFNLLLKSNEKPCDTYLDFSGWGKGCVWINGFNIGRFWEIGPQKRLYVPAPLLKSGSNEIIIFETEGKRRPYIKFCDKSGW